MVQSPGQRYRYSFISSASTPKQKKRQKRIPYSEEEKRCLLEGVKQFGKQWRDILAHYDYVFSVNNRSNVNLKDLYRTLMIQNARKD